MNLRQQLQVPCRGRFRLADCRPGVTPGVEGRGEAEAALPGLLKELGALQYALYAESRRAVLVVLQAMDAAGKDGAIRHVFGPLNPQGCRVTAFKAPTPEELAHDYLWRIHQAVPRVGEIGVFNRSHYEDVLVVRVRGLVPKPVWRARYDQINAFEAHLAANGVVIVKLFLHIDAAEQAERLQARLDDPERQWKFAAADIEERRHWCAYQEAYEDALRRCSTPHAPWYVIPANRKWYRNWAVATIMAETMRAMKARFPPPPPDIPALKRRLRRSLS